MEKRSYYMSKSGSGPHALPQQERARDGGGHRAEAPRVQDDLETSSRRACRRPGVPLAPYPSFHRRYRSEFCLEVSPDVRRRIIDQHRREGRPRSTRQQVDPDLRIRQDVRIAFRVKDVQCRDVSRAPLDERLGHR